MSKRSTISNQGPVEIYVDCEDCETICIFIDDSLEPKGPSYGDPVMTKEQLKKLHDEISAFLNRSKANS